MKRIAVTVAIAVAVAPAARAATSTWNLDPAHAHVGFTVRHLGISNVRGQFGNMDATLEVDDQDVTKSRVQATVDVTTIDTRHPKRDADLLSSDFFDSANHPRMTFRSTKVEKSDDRKLKVTGDLTIRGNTKPITLDVEYTDPVKDVKGAQRRAIQAKGKINRKDYGLTYNRMVEAVPVVGDEVNLEMEAEFVKAPAAPAGQAKAEGAAGKGESP
jgi:polyisoprenoid-binding protein YceI